MPGSKPFAGRGIRATWTTLLLATLLSLALAAPALAGITVGGGVWEWQSPLPQGNRLYGVEVAPGGTAWTVGIAGAVLKSADGGATWTSAGPKTDAELTAVDFVDELKGHVVGKGGAYLSTADGGATWDVRTLSTADLWGVQFVSASEGFIAADGGEVLTTVDGGATWTTHALPGSWPLYDLSFVDADTGWVCGYGGYVARTTDGGATWTRLGDAGASDLYGIDFADSQTGWAVGESDVIYGTTDGGATWSPVYDDWDRYMMFSDVDALGTSSVVAVGMGGRAVVKSPTQDWTTVSTQRGDWLFGVIWDSASHALVVGEAGSIAVSTDGCAQFLSQSGETERTIEAVSAIHPEKAVAVGMSGVALYTNDGATWVRLADPVCYETLLDVSMADGSYGCAVGEYGMVLTTDDGGLTWDPQTSGTTAQLEGVCMISPSQGWAVGTLGRIFVTVDYGVTWTLQTPELSASNIWFEAVDFVDAQHGWAVANGGSIFATATGGADPDDAGPLTGWTPVPGSGYDLNAVDFVSATQGWAVGDASTIIHTENGGQTWVDQHPAFIWAPFTDFTGVAFADNGLDGWVVGSTGIVMVTHDGGDTWVLQTAGARPWFEDVDVVDSLDGPRAWAVGRRLAIVALRQTPETIPPATNDDAPAAWSRKPVTVTFAATDAGSGVARVTSRIDDKSWQRGATHVVAAPADHLNDGAHTVTYFSEDHAGNREAAKACTVRIDTRRPECKAPYSASVRRYRYVTLRYRVNDLKPNAGTARVMITIKTLGGTKVKTIAVGTKKVNATLGYTFRCTLAKRTYKFYVTAVDMAGNTQSSAGVNKLVVK
jgi:photosystem II stability/assembly factor-like uncharacterized protein